MGENMKKVGLMDTVFVECSRRLSVCISVFLAVFSVLKIAKNACKNGPKSGDHKMSLKAKL